MDGRPSDNLSLLQDVLARIGAGASSERQFPYIPTCSGFDCYHSLGYHAGTGTQALSSIIIQDNEVNICLALRNNTRFFQI